MSSGDGLNGNAPAEPVLAPPAAGAAPDAVQLRTEAANRIAAAFGNIVSVMMQSEACLAMTLSQVRSLVVPALSTRQYSLAQVRQKDSGELRPVGVLLWASVSQEVDGRLQASPGASVRLDPSEWMSGDQLWIVEGIGERAVIAGLIRRMRETSGRGRTIRIKVAGADGRPVVRTLPAAL